MKAKTEVAMNTNQQTATERFPVKTRGNYWLNLVQLQVARRHSSRLKLPSLPNPLHSLTGVSAREAI
jgi:hypothetical protein